MKIKIIFIILWSIINRYLEGGNLLERIIYMQRPFFENEAKEIIRQSLSALSYCQTNNIMHRDIKLQNIMFQNRKPDSGIKLIDFGFASNINVKNKFQSLRGTPYFMPPELFLNKGPHCKSDIYSLGIVLYFVLRGQFPFIIKNIEELKAFVIKHNYENDSFNELVGLSELGKLFLKRMLTYDLNKRPSADELLNDPWLNTSTKIIPISDFDKSEIYSNIMKYKVG